MMNTKNGISTISVIGLIFAGLIAVTVITKIISGGDFDTSGSALTNRHSNVSRTLGTTDSAGSPQASSPTQARGANAGELAPDFTLTSLDGRQISLSDYKGVKPVVLDFFATWCPNCRRDMPKQQALYEKYGGAVEVIAINLNESQKTVEKYITKEGFTFPVVMDPGGRVARSFDVTYTNAHIYIDINGVIQRTNYSDTTDSLFQSILN